MKRAHCAASKVIAMIMACAALTAAAQDYPTRAIHVVTAEAGGGLDERYTAYLGGTWGRFPGMTFKAGAITSVASLAPGREVRAVLSDGSAEMQVLRVRPLPQG